MTHPSAGQASPLTSIACCVFTLAEDRTARVWDACELRREIAGLRDVGEIFDAAFDWGRGQPACSIRSPGNELALWDSRTKRRVAFDKHNAVAAELSADRRYVLTFDDYAAAVWDSKTGRQVTSLGDWQGVDHARLSPDGQRVAMVSRYGWAIIWDIATDRKVWDDGGAPGCRAPRGLQP